MLHLPAPFHTLQLTQFCLAASMTQSLNLAVRTHVCIRAHHTHSALDPDQQHGFMHACQSLPWQLYLRALMCHECHIVDTSHPLSLS